MATPKSLRRILLIVGLAIVIGLAAGVLRDDRPETRLDVLWEVADFELTSSSGGEVGKGDLLGQVWLVDFIFTRCAGPCPELTRRMLAVQKSVPGDQPFRLVSITVDPAYDTPEVLQAYALHYGADPDRWLFLTGPAESMSDKIQEAFFTGVQREGKDPAGIIHQTHFLLVDHRGRVRRIHRMEDGMSGLLDDIRTLLGAAKAQRPLAAR